MSPTRWIRDHAVLSRRVPDGILLLAPAAREPILVTGSGFALWDMLDDPITVDDLVVTAAASFACEPARIAPDVERTVHALAAHGLVREAQ